MRKLSISLLFLANPVFAGTFTTAPLTGDGDSGISGATSYTHAIDLGAAGNVTVNGAVFTGGFAGGTNTYGMTGADNTLPAWAGSGVTGATAGLFNGFQYNGTGGGETLTLNNLRIGQTYTTTFYNAVWGGPRSQNITTSDGGTVTFDADAQGGGSLLKYNFTATSNSLTYNFAPNQVASFHQYAFSNEVAGYKSLLTDNFYAPSNPNTLDLNFNLAARQGGSLVTTGGPIAWVGVNNTQLGNPTGGIDNGNYLLNAFGTGNAALDRNFNGSASQGGLSISFDVEPNSTDNPDNSQWQALNIGQDAANKNDFVNAGNPHLGLIFRGDGRLEIWDGGNNLTPVNPNYSGSIVNQLTHIELLITDPTDANPFDGVGQTDVSIYSNGVLAYSVSKLGGYANNYINFHNSYIGGVDNLNIAQIPESSVLTLSGLAIGLVLRRKRTESSRS